MPLYSRPATKESLGLDQVDNTSDANKPVSTAQQAAISALRPYAVYTALLTQSGTAAPVATVLQNTLSGTPAWARTGTGNYTITLASAFTANKTAVIINAFQSNPATGGGATSITRTSDSVYTIRTADILTGANQDSLLSNAMIEIRVYP